jgi:hypothetical protein
MRWPRAPSGNAKRESVAFQNWSRSVWSGIETSACGQRARTWSCPSQDPSSISFPEGGSRNLGERLSASHIDVGPALPAGWEVVGPHRQSPRDFETPSAQRKPKTVIENLWLGRTNFLTASGRQAQDTPPIQRESYANSCRVLPLSVLTTVSWSARLTKSSAPRENRIPASRSQGIRVGTAPLLAN